ncbi:MAG: hypothetical protein F6K10_41725, partial [Moorea sp. SIO2B7]|nr:hypothetical protein [Moorena sp. SIO2B7]
MEKAKTDNFKGIPTEHEVFEKAGIPYVLPELREGTRMLDIAIANQLPV